MVTVVIGNRAGTYPDEVLPVLMEMASKAVPQGIYAIRKKNYVEFKAGYLSKTRIREARRHYKKLGFKVYANGV